MTDYLNFTLLTCLALFLFASGSFLLGFRHGRAASLSARWGHITFALGTLGLTVLAVSTIIIDQTNSLTPIHHTTIWFATAIGWMSVIAWFVWNLQLIGAFTAPLITINLLIDAFFGVSHLNSASETASSPLVYAHIGFSLIGQSFAVAACGASLLLLWQERKLKHRQIGDLPASFPAMDTLTAALNHTLWVGFIFLTIGLLSGAVIATAYVLPPDFAISAKASWAILVWGWYFSILVLRNILLYRPQRIARMSLLGFAILAASWFGMAFSFDWAKP